MPAPTSPPAHALLAYVKQSRDAVLITDGANRVQWVNPSFTALTGYADADVLGHPVRDILGIVAGTSGSAPGHPQVVAFTHANGLDLEIEVETVIAGSVTADTTDGNSQHVYVLRAPREATEAFASMRLRHALLAKSAGIGFAERDLITGRGHWDKQALRLHGLHEDAAAPSIEALFAFIAPEDRKRSDADQQQLLSASTPIDTEYRIRRPDGVTAWLHRRSWVERDAAGRAIRTISFYMDITSRKEAEQRSAELALRLALATKAGGIALWEHSLTTDESHWNIETFALHGLAPGSPTPTRNEWRERFIHPDDREAQRVAAEQAIRSTRPYDYEHRIVRADGAVRWVHSRAHFFDDEGGLGRPTRALGVTIDITDRKHTEAQLRETVTRLQLASSGSGVGIFEHNVDRSGAYWSDEAFRLFGLTPAEQAPVWPDLLARIHPDDRELLEHRWNAFATSTTFLESEFRIFRPDLPEAERERWLLMRGRREPAQDSRPPRVVGIAIDITSRKRAELRAHDLSGLLQLTATAIGMGQWQRDLVTGEIHWSDAMKRLFGLAPDAPVPSRDDCLAMIDPADRDAALAFREALPLVGHNNELTFTIRHPNGETRHVLARRTVQYSADRTPLRVHGVLIDITELRRAQQQLHDLTEWMSLAGAAAGVGFFRLAANGVTLHADRQMRLHYGLPSDGSLPQIEDFLRNGLPEDASAIQAVHAQALAGDAPFETEYRVRDPVTGKVRHLVTRRVRLKDRGEVVGAVIDVTASRESQLALAEANRRLALATRVARLGIWEWCPITGEEIWDARMREIYGVVDPSWTPSVARWLELLHPDDRGRAQRPYVDHLQQLSGGESEHRVVRPDGDERTVLSSYWVMRDAQGAAVRVLGTDLDITEARRSQTERETLSRRVDLMARELGIGLWEWDVVRSRGTWNAQMYALFGREHGVDPRQWIEAVHPADRASARHHLAKALHGRDSFESQFRIVLPNGEVRWIASRGNVERDPRGAPLRMIGVNWDMTDLLHADHERKQLTERLVMAASGAGLGFWTFDVQTMSGYVNDQTLALYGRSRDSDPEFTQHWLRYIHVDDRRHIVAVVKRAVTSDEPVDAHFRVVLPDGRVRYLAGRSHRSIAADGRITINGVNWDVTEQHSNEQALREKEMAERASAAKTEFLSRISHELRTPLNAILGFAQILDIDTAHPLDPSQRERLAHIQKAGWHLLALINDILDLSRIEAGKAQLHMDTVAVADVIEECMGLIATAAHKRKLTIRNHIVQTPVPDAWADRIRLKQVLLNLLSNAVKYNREGGAIDVSAKTSTDGHIIVAIGDTGAGLSSQQLTQIFQPFNRLGHETAAIEGTGIGLTIAQKLTEQMGGTIEVSSERGAGSEFRVVLQAASTPHPAALPAEHIVRADVTGTVLYVEDNPANIAVVEHALGLRPGIRLFKARDGTTAIAMATVCQPDLMLLDLRLPDTDGITLISELQASASLKAVPCVAVSANASAADIEAVRRAGFVDFWPKPVQLDQLLTGIDRWLTQRKRSAAAQPRDAVR